MSNITCIASFAHFGVFCRRAISKIEAFECLFSHLLQPMKSKHWQKESFSGQTLPPGPPCAAFQLDFAGWAPGAGRRRSRSKSRHIQAQHLVSMTFQLRGFAVAPLVRKDCYGFVLPSDDA